MENPSTDTKREHGHQGHWPVGITVEGGGGNHRYPPEGKCPPPQRPI